MTHFKWWWPFKNNKKKSSYVLLEDFNKFSSQVDNSLQIVMQHITSISKDNQPSQYSSYMNGFDKGVEIGIMLSTTVDEKVKKSIFDRANDEALRRINGNHS